MATNTYTQYGETVKYGLTDLGTALITSATITYARDTKEYANYVGNVVAIVTDLNPRFEAEITVTMLTGSSASEVQSSCASWLKTQACGSTFCTGIDTVGTTIITDVKVEGKNDDATTLTVSAVYYPYVTSSE